MTRKDRKVDMSPEAVQARLDRLKAYWDSPEGKADLQRKIEIGKQMDAELERLGMNGVYCGKLKKK